MLQVAVVIAAVIACPIGFAEWVNAALPVAESGLNTKDVARDYAAGIEERFGGAQVKSDVGF
jgi:hypothetical protein